MLPAAVEYNFPVTSFDSLSEWRRCAREAQSLRAISDPETDAKTSKHQRA